MSYTADKIVDRLYQGGYPPVGNALKDAGVDVLVLCARENADASKYEGLIVIVAPGDDDERPQMLASTIDVWKAAAHDVARHVREGRVVLVTCMAGHNRSGLVTALALRELTGWPGEKIIQHIQDRRLGALYNDTFVDYIINNFPSEEPQYQVR